MSTRPRTGHLLFCIKEMEKKAGKETAGGRGNRQLDCPDNRAPCPKGRHQIDDIKDIYQLIFGLESSNRNLILMLVVIPPHHSQMAGILIHFLDV